MDGDDIKAEDASDLSATGSTGAFGRRAEVVFEGRIPNNERDDSSDGAMLCSAVVDRLVDCEKMRVLLIPDRRRE